MTLVMKIDQSGRQNLKDNYDLAIEIPFRLTRGADQEQLLPLQLIAVATSLENIWSSSLMNSLNVFNDLVDRRRYVNFFVLMRQCYSMLNTRVTSRFCDELQELSVFIITCRE